MADDSDSSGLSEAPEEEVKKLAPIFAKAKGATKVRFPPPVVSPPKPKRPPSPPRDEQFADNPDIAFIVMFRSRFNDALPGKLAHFGPQDVERGVTDEPPSPQVESLLCALLALVLNRKKPVERGHHGRALEEAVLSQKSQWPHSWAGVNPLHGNRDFTTMSPTERLNLLRTLIMWSLHSSEAIQGIIKERYKQARHNDDENQPLSVQPWGMDGDKRRYFLIQGLDDTNYRVYREGSRYTKNASWINVAGDIDEMKALAKKLEEVDGTQAARRFAGRIMNAIPTFEASEEKRRRREYRQIRRQAFTRPEPGFSMYEGRTRGKRQRYTYDDDEGAFDSDATSTRRSTRNQSSRNTPMEAGPTYTASGRQVRQPRQGDYGESLLRQELDNGTDELSHEYNGVGDDEDSEPVRNGGRAMRSAGRSAVNGSSNPRKRKHIDGYNEIDAMSEDDSLPLSGDEWDSDRNEAEAEGPEVDEEDDEMSEDEVDEDDEPQSLVVRLRVPSMASRKQESGVAQALETNGTAGLKREDLGQGHAAHDLEHHHHAAQAQAGAPKIEPASHSSLPNGLSHGYTSAQPAPAPSSATYFTTTPPSGASSYPTPASSSFPATDAKSIVQPPSSVPLYQGATAPAPVQLDQQKMYGY